jgi:hypothetical protein
MVNEPRTNGMVKEPRDGERRQQSASDERRELVHYLLCAFNGNKALRQRLGALFHELEAEGIDPRDVDAWSWAASTKLDAVKQLVGLMPGAEHAVIISERVNPLLERYPLLKALGGWSLIQNSYDDWHYLSRFATLSLSADLRALLRNKETEWFREGVEGKEDPDGGREKPKLLVADLWEKLGLADDPDRDKLLAAHRREWPILTEPATVELGTEYDDFEKGGMVPCVSFTINVSIPSDPRHYSYADVMSALDEFLEAARKETRRQYKAILKRGKEQGLKERPANYKPWQSALWLYLVMVRGKSPGWIAKEGGVDESQVSRSCKRAVELLGL